MYRHLQLFIAIIIGCLDTITIHSVPNYFDPNNIIQAPEIFWSFGLTEAGIIKLRHYPTARKELLSKIKNHVTAFQEHAAKRIQELQQDDDPERANLYTHALNIVKEAQSKALTILAPRGLSDSDKADIDNILFADTAEKKLRLETKTIKALKKLKAPLMGGSRFEEKVPIRAALEKHYQHMTSYLDELSQRPKLSSDDHALIKRAHDALNSAYDAVHKYVNFN